MTAPALLDWPASLFTFGEHDPDAYAAGANDRLDLLLPLIDDLADGLIRATSGDAYNPWADVIRRYRTLKGDPS